MKKFRWTIEVEVDEDVVASGFEMTDANVQDLVQSIPRACANVIASPSDEDIARAQGYPDLTYWLRDKHGIIPISDFPMPSDGSPTLVDSPRKRSN